MTEIGLATPQSGTATNMEEAYKVGLQTVSSADMQAGPAKRQLQPQLQTGLQTLSGADLQTVCSAEKAAASAADGLVKILRLSLLRPR